MNCSVCSAEPEEGAQFCGVCGTRIEGDDFLYSADQQGDEQPMVGFGGAISRGYKNYVNFSGRATRAEYWWWWLYGPLAMFLLTFTGILGEYVFLVLLLLVLIVPFISLNVRRFHDCGNSAWFLLIFLVPFGGLVILGLHCRGGQPYENRYGPNPRTTPRQ